MIIGGYYYPVEMFGNLTHIDPATGMVVGSATVGIAFGNRTGGKTVGFGITMLKLFEEKGERCMLLARTADNVKECYLEKWWRNKIFPVDDTEGVIQGFLKNHEITFDKKTMYADGQPVCYTEAIHDSARVKDTGNYQYCTNIILDEAVQPGERYLSWKGRSYMERVFEIWQTVARGWKDSEKLTHLIFIANVSEVDNWVFNDLGVNRFVRSDTKMTCQFGIHVDMVLNKAAKKKIDTSIMGIVMRNSVSGRVYNASAQANEARDNRAFIRRMGLNFENLLVQFAVRRFFLGIFKTPDGYHAARIEKDSRSKIFCNSVDLHTEEIEYKPGGDWENAMRKAYFNSKVTFQTQEDKGLFLEYIHLG